MLEPPELLRRLNYGSVLIYLLNLWILADHHFPRHEPYCRALGPGSLLGKPELELF